MRDWTAALSTNFRRDSTEHDMKVTRQFRSKMAKKVKASFYFSIFIKISSSCLLRLEWRQSQILRDFRRLVNCADFRRRMDRVNIQKSVAFFAWVNKFLVLGLTPTGSGVSEKIKILAFLKVITPEIGVKVVFGPAICGFIRKSIFFSWIFKFSIFWNPSGGSNVHGQNRLTKIFFGKNFRKKFFFCFFLEWL